MMKSMLIIEPRNMAFFCDTIATRLSLLSLGSIKRAMRISLLSLGSIKRAIRTAIQSSHERHISGLLCRSWTNIPRLSILEVTTHRTNFNQYMRIVHTSLKSCCIPPGYTNSRSRQQHSAPSICQINSRSYALATELMIDDNNIYIGG